MDTKQNKIDQLNFLTYRNSIEWQIAVLKVKVLREVRRLSTSAKAEVIDRIEKIMNEAPAQIKNLPPRPGGLSAQEICGKWEKLEMEFK